MPPRYLAVLLLAGLLPAVFAQSNCATSLTGPQVGTSFQPLDTLIQNAMKTANVQGGAFAVTYQGRLVLAHAYGCAGVAGNLPAQPDSLFRIASVSKTFTAISILQLYEAGKLGLNDPVFTKWLTNFTPLNGQAMDPQVAQITVQELLQHTSGWDRSLTKKYLGQPYTEPLGIANFVASKEGRPLPGTCSDVISAFLSVPLDHAPGTTYAYSNFGYCILGRLVERVSGMGYEQYVQQNILTPLAIARQKLGASLMSDAVNGEVTYYDTAPPVPSVFPFITSPVQQAYGGNYVETLDSTGGWVANTVDLVRFMDGIDGRRGGPLLKPSTIQLMQTYTPAQNFTANSYYGLGFNMEKISSGIRWSKDGALSATASYAVHSPSGFSWAVVFNTNPDWGASPSTEDLGPGFMTSLVNSLEQTLNPSTAPASGDLYAQFPSKLLTPSISSVVQGATFQPGIVPGSWVTIKGQNLATATRIWWDTEFTQNNNQTVLPTEIDHVLVTIGGQPAPVYYVSPGQLNVQAPDPLPAGPTTVQVIRDGTVSATAQAQVLTAAPGYFTYGNNGTLYVAAVHLNGVTVGDPSMVPGTTPAVPGETLEIFGTGLAASPAGAIFSAAALLVNPVITIGGQPATVTYSGVVGPGLFQMNVVVPQVAAGDQPITLTLNNAAAPSGVVLPVVIR